MKKYILFLSLFGSVNFVLASDYEVIMLDNLDDQDCHKNIYQKNIFLRLTQCDQAIFQAKLVKLTDSCVWLFRSGSEKSAHAILGVNRIGVLLKRSGQGDYKVKTKKKYELCSTSYHEREYYFFEDEKSLYCSLMRMIFESGVQNNFSEEELFEKKKIIYKKIKNFYEKIDTAKQSNQSNQYLLNELAALEETCLNE